MIASLNALAFGLSCSNQLMVANQNAHAFGPSSTVARMKMKTKSRSLVVTILLLFCLLDLVLLGLPFLGCP